MGGLLQLRACAVWRSPRFTATLGGWGRLHPQPRADAEGADTWLMLCSPSSSSLSLPPSFCPPPAPPPFPSSFSHPFLPPFFLLPSSSPLPLFSFPFPSLHSPSFAWMERGKIPLLLHRLRMSSGMHAGPLLHTWAPSCGSLQVGKILMCAEAGHSCAQNSSGPQSPTPLPDRTVGQPHSVLPSPCSYPG